MDVQAFWRDVISQNEAALPSYFAEDAAIFWHCSNERFTVEEYIRANCDYPGRWDGEIERLQAQGDVVILAGRVFPKGGGASFHVVSFLTLRGDRIARMDEYWAEDCPAPPWREEMRIGRPIR